MSNFSKWQGGDKFITIKRGGSGRQGGTNSGNAGKKGSRFIHVLSKALGGGKGAPDTVRRAKRMDDERKYVP